MTKYYTYLISAVNTEVSYTNLIYFLILSIQKLKSVLKIITLQLSQLRDGFFTAQ